MSSMYDFQLVIAERLSSNTFSYGVRPLVALSSRTGNARASVRERVRVLTLTLFFVTGHTESRGHKTR